MQFEWTLTLNDWANTNSNEQTRAVSHHKFVTGAHPSNRCPSVCRFIRISSLSDWQHLCDLYLTNQRIELCARWLCGHTDHGFGLLSYTHSREWWGHKCCSGVTCWHCLLVHPHLPLSLLATATVGTALYTHPAVSIDAHRCKPDRLSPADCRGPSPRERAQPKGKRTSER